MAQQFDLIVIRNAKVDMMSTKNLDMHGRKVQNAGLATDSKDYVTLGQVQDIQAELEGEIQKIPAGPGVSGTSGFTQETLIPYSAVAILVPTVGIANTAPGNVFGQHGDVENLRVGYENLRKAFEDMRAKLIAGGFMA